jgi:hypothetical protein
MSRFGATPTTCDEEIPMTAEFENVYAELSIEFGQNCNASVTTGATNRLREIFDINILPLLESGAISWQGREKKYLLACSAGLGRSCDQLARGEVTSDNVSEAAKGSVKCWERVCPLPHSPETTGVRRGCRTLRTLLDLPLA